MAPMNNVKLGESIAMLSLKRSVVAMKIVFERMCLRQPTCEDLEKKISINNARDFSIFVCLSRLHALRLK